LTAYVETAGAVTRICSDLLIPGLKRLCENLVERHSSVALAGGMSDSGESLYELEYVSHKL
jgi:hypothetical protein